MVQFLGTIIEGSVFEVDGNVESGALELNCNVYGEIILNGGGYLDPTSYYYMPERTGKLEFNVPSGKTMYGGRFTLTQGEEGTGHFELTNNGTNYIVAATGGGDLTISGFTFATESKVDLNNVKLSGNTWKVCSDVVINGNMDLNRAANIIIEKEGHCEIKGDLSGTSVPTVTSSMNPTIENNGTMRIHGDIMSIDTKNVIDLRSSKGSVFEVDGNVEKGALEVEFTVYGEIILNGGGYLGIGYSSYMPQRTGKIECNIPSGKSIKSDLFSFTQGKECVGHFELTNDGTNYIVAATGGGDLTISGFTFVTESKVDLNNVKLSGNTWKVCSDVIINGNMDLNRAANIIIEKEGCCEIKGNLSGTSVPNVTSSNNPLIKNNGTMRIHGDIMSIDTKNVIDLSSNEGSVFEVDGNVEKGALELRFNVYGEIILNGGGYLDPTSYYYMPERTGKLEFNVPSGKTMYGGRFTLTQGEEGTGHFELTNNGTNYIVAATGGGDLNISGFTFVTDSEVDLNNVKLGSTWKVNDKLCISGNVTVDSSGKMIFSDGGVLELCGKTKQTVSYANCLSYPFNNLKITNISDEGVEFSNNIKVIGLFNHNQNNNFTLYNQGKSSSFVDSDGDGAIDSEDFEPTNDKVKDTKLTIYEIPDQNSEEGVACTPEITVTRENGKTLRKGIDYTVSYQNNGGVGEAVVKVTGLQIYKNSDPAERKFNILCETHQYEKTTIEPTCTEDGKDIYTCKLCKHSYEEPIQTTGHSWADDYTVDVEPACTKTGLKSIHCSKCEEITDEQIMEALGHEWDDGTVTKENSCTEEGNLEYKCTRDGCDAAYEGAINLTDHSWEDDYTIDIKPTCTEAGLKSIHCHDCNAVKDIQNIAALGHAWEDDYTVDVEPTCTETGLKSIHCHDCNEVKDVQSIDTLGHTWKDDYTVDKEPTCTEEGSKSIHCSECDATKDTRTITAIGHEYESETSKATISANGSVVTKCSVCGDVKDTTTIYYPKTMKLQVTTYTYNGGVKTPAVSIADANGNTVSSDNYSVSYASGRKSVGRYKVTVTFKGDKYAGSKYTYFNINPKGTSISKVYGAKKAFTVKWKKQSSKMATSTITGYQIRYSTSSKMTSAKTKTVKGYKYTSKKITKLSAKKKYYVQVRTYKIVSGKTYYSPWSSIKSVKTK